MVNRPPPKAGQGGSKEHDGMMMGRGGRMRRGAGMEWSLRSLQKIDTGAQHFLQSYLDESDSEDEITFATPDHSAYEIFKGRSSEGAGLESIEENGEIKRHSSGGLTTLSSRSSTSPGLSFHKTATTRSVSDSVWATLNAPLRTGIVDGKKVTFELLSGVTQKPTVPREVRLRTNHVELGPHRSPAEARLRFWLMRFSVARLTVVFFASFLLLNVVFAILFHFPTPDRCCGDPSFSFGDTFAFTIQTSTTIGYGSFSPVGYANNFLVVVVSYTSTLINTLFAGLLFTKFVTPVINIQFADCMTLCNVNGVPCLNLRLGNADGHENPLTDINVRLTYSYQIPYKDQSGSERFFRQTEELKLLSSRQHGLREAWDLRHVVDEHSPLFGLRFNEHPGDKIYVFTLSVDAVQELTKSTVNVQTEYALGDILIGHSFVPIVRVEHDPTTQQTTSTSDYTRISDTEPYPVWYPAQKGAYGTDKIDQAYTSTPSSSLR